MKSKKLKMYVWENVLTDYSSGMMVALARSPEEARELIRAKASYLPESDVNQEPQCVTGPAAFFVYGGG